MTVHPLSHTLEPAEHWDPRPSKEEVEQAFRTIIRYAGDNPNRDGLTETPERARRALDEYFAGYDDDPAMILQKTFSETAGYDEMVVLREIPFESHCEHHLAPIIGRAWVAYLPGTRVWASPSWPEPSMPLQSACRSRSG